MSTDQTVIVLLMCLVVLYHFCMRNDAALLTKVKQPVQVKYQALKDWILNKIRVCRRCLSHSSVSIRIAHFGCFVCVSWRRSLSLSLSLSVLTAIFLASYQNFSIPDLIGATGDESGGDSWSYKTRKAPIKSSPPTNQHPVFYRPDALPVAQPTVSDHGAAGDV